MSVEVALQIFNGRSPSSFGGKQVRKKIITERRSLITLRQKDYSEITMYDDYAIDDEYFHW